MKFEELSAREIISGLSERRYTSVEVTRYFLDRISEINPSLNAVPFLFKTQAIQQAKESDDRRTNGNILSKLDGLPMTLKDAMRVRGEPSTYGMQLFRRYRPKQDSSLVADLRRSGVVFLGRSAVPTGALDWNCRNSIYPECVNPFDSSKVPVGSSGGAAAALAMGLTPLELGSDLGGSIRYPAHCCGVYGVRTTDGWLPINDLGPDSVGSSFQRLVTCGPMARNLEDLDLLLELYDDDFPCKESQVAYSPPNEIAYSISIVGVKPTETTQKLFHQFLERLRKAGHRLVEKQPELDFEELYRDWGMISGYEYTGSIPRLLRNYPFKRIYSWILMDRRLGPGPMTTYFKRGMLAKESEYKEALLRREAVLKVTDTFFKRHRFWILPVAPSSAISRAACGKHVKTEDGTFEYSRYLGAYTVPTTMMGTPALSIPIGRDETNMPLGVQIHSARFSDRRLVQSARGFEMSFE